MGRLRPPRKQDLLGGLLLNWDWNISHLSVIEKSVYLLHEVENTQSAHYLCW